MTLSVEKKVNMHFEDFLFDWRCASKKQRKATKKQPKFRMQVNIGEIESLYNDEKPCYNNHCEYI